MDALRLKTNTLTVTVFTRHSAECSRTDDPQWKRCRCRKWLYIYRDGKPERITAKTRSWEQAERYAQEIRDSADPLKQKQRELDRLIDAKKAEAITVEDALDRWFRSLKISSQGTQIVYRVIVRKIKAWASERGFTFLSEVTSYALDEWRGKWSTDAKRDDDRMGPSTQSEFQVRLKKFFAWAYRQKLILNDPAEGLDTIKKEHRQTLPLTDEQFSELLAATHRFDAAQRRSCDQFGQDLRALFLLMRWSGLRISDAAALPRTQPRGNRLVVSQMKKTKQPITLIVPDVVVNALRELPQRPGIDAGYYFWSRKCSHLSLSTTWDQKIGRLNEFLDFKDEHGQPMRFHSHMLRDTFAVNMLLNDVPLEEVSRMLGHSSVKVTERHYAPWVIARQRQMENRMIAAIQQMGVSVSL